MIADGETNVVFVANTLERRFPAVYRGLASILGEHGIPLRTIPGTLDVWCRDYLPIQVAEDRFVQFRYEPDYLTGKYRYLRVDGKISSSLPWIRNCEPSEIVLDGGNLVRWTDKVIVCDKVFGENPGRKPSELLRALGQVLGVGQVIVIPTEPGDVVGHSDGVVRFAEGEEVLVNDYRHVDGRYWSALRRVLREAGLKVVEVPYLPRTGRTRGIPTAFGCYLNPEQA
jgi:agmatine deiminase